MDNHNLSAAVRSNNEVREEHYSLRFGATRDKANETANWFTKSQWATCQLKIRVLPSNQCMQRGTLKWYRVEYDFIGGIVQEEHNIRKDRPLSSSQVINTTSIHNTHCNHFHLWFQHLLSILRLSAAASWGSVIILHNAFLFCCSTVSRWSICAKWTYYRYWAGLVRSAKHNVLDHHRKRNFLLTTQRLINSSKVDRFPHHSPARRQTNPLQTPLWPNHIQKRKCEKQ